MASSRKNRSLHLDIEAISALSFLKTGLLSPVYSLMNQKECEEVITTGKYNNRTFPFPFILAPSGKTNEAILTSTKKGETLDMICEGNFCGTITVKEVFEVDPKERLKQIYGTNDLTHPGVSATFNRLGKYAISGEYTVCSNSIDEIKLKIEEAKSRLNANNVSAIMMAANPLHRAHERIIRQRLDKTDLFVIFLLRPFTKGGLSYELRLRCVEYFIENYLPKNKVLIVPLDHSYIFAGYNEVVIDAIVAKNFGCDTLLIGQNHAGVGMYYDSFSNKSVADRLEGIDIEIDIASEYVYCNECNTLVSTLTCPHGSHHQISYHSESILELMKLGLLPPAVLMRKEISSLILSELFPHRFKNLEKLYYDILPNRGLLEEHSEQDFYLELMKLYQTTSLT